MELKNNPAFVKAAAKLSLVNFKDGFGHDTCGAMGEIKLGSKKLVKFFDDGWGGETQQDYFEGGKELMDAFIKDNNILQHVYDDMVASAPDLWSDGGPEQFSNHEAVNFIFDYLANKKSDEKFQKEVDKMKDNAVVLIVNNGKGYRKIQWKGKLPLSVIAKQRNGVESLQSAYDELKAKMNTESDKFAHTEHLQSLGVKL